MQKNNKKKHSPPAEAKWILSRNWLEPKWLEPKWLEPKWLEKMAAPGPPGCRRRNRPNTKDVGQNSESVMEGPIAIQQSACIKSANTEGFVGDHGSASHRIPAPLTFGQLWNGQSGLAQCKVHFVCYIPDGYAHRMNAPCKRSTRDWGSSSLVEAWWIPVDWSESGCNELHSIPPKIPDLEERCT